MTANNRYAIAAVLAFSLLVPLTANATLARAVTFDEKVEASEAIILGRCTNTESRWDNEHRWIITYSTFAIEKTMKGNAIGQITVITPGGTVEGIHQDSIGIPVFHQGDDHVIFVRNTAAGPTVSFMSQGAYDIVRDGNERIVQPVPSQAVVIDTQRGLAVAPESPRALRQFEDDVRQSIRRSAVNRMEMTRKREKQQASLWPVFSKNKWLIALALLGIALAAWQMAKRA